MIVQVTKEKRAKECLQSSPLVLKEREGSGLKAAGAGTRRRSSRRVRPFENEDRFPDPVSS